MYISAEKKVPVVSIMHTEVEDVDPCLDIVDDHWPGPVSVYAHSARWEGQVCIFDDTITPAEYAVRARSWLGRGVRIIGGCCGLSVEHIQALKRIL